METTECLAPASRLVHCHAEIMDGNYADPSYAFCGLPFGHAGDHGAWEV